MRFILIVVLFSYSANLESKSFVLEDYTVKDKKLKHLVISEAAVFSLALVGFNELWYKNYPKSNFHFVNDNSAWLQMDKFGHAATSYYGGVNGIKLYKWAGLKYKKAVWVGGLTGFLFNSTIEILDGFSANWGASLGDVFANSMGSLLAISQELYWKEQKVMLKYSYSKSVIADSNNELFGNTILQRSLKDYNGQTYWFSVNINSFFKLDNSSFPKWLNFALGYSGNGMISAQNKTGDNRYRQFLFSLDVDLTRINTKNKFLKKLTHVFSFVKIPFPAFEFSNNQLKLHSIYF
tara:strand:- start:83 stop:961 length:879 start_codon:yes stop_codon:yes gene_type:complete